MPAAKPRRHQRVRQEIAAEAARIMATEGQRSYLLAKRKAAERLGASTRNGLPSNSDIELALKQWQQLYGGSDHEAHLHTLRQAALEAMRFLEPFRPRLVGPVLEGTADRFSRISLHVFADDPDAVVRFLMEHNIPFSQERRKVRWHDGGYRHIDVLVVEADSGIVEMGLMIGPDARQPLPSPVDGRPSQRMARAELEELIRTTPPNRPESHR
jgi:hypothetical protein